MKLTHLLVFATIFQMHCTPNEPSQNIESGVEWSLAQQRFACVSDITYNLHFNIPLQRKDSIRGLAKVDFHWVKSKHPLYLDFNQNGTKVLQLKLNNETIEINWNNDHLLIPSSLLSKGPNLLEIDFVAGENSLNRSEDYLYTLLVPDRASSVFPCFDQPDLKAKFNLSLSIPSPWVAVGNGAIKEEKVVGDRKHCSFEETLPVSTYLFAFATGSFRTITAEKAGRKMTMYHREPDTAKLEMNADNIFQLHADALQWLEQYTGIKYPFQKLDFVLIPTFQYGGMEHIGAIFYKASSLMLDKTASENQLLGRASLIAHETAHQWFGDLVTMKWFNDVWLKEVFANFMAAKIVHPHFPNINHDLRFLLAHQPAAYAEDRTAGTHPIQQELHNLKYAGSLYGAIIYQKAPVVMKQLEYILGEENFRDGLRQYLQQYAFSNATWDDLVSILDGRTDKNLKSWSESWVKESGVPHISQSLSASGVQLLQTSTSSAGKYWSQHSVMAVGDTAQIMKIPVVLEGKISTADWGTTWSSRPQFVLPNASPMSYGYFSLDTASLFYFVRDEKEIDDPLLRGVIQMTLFEEMLNGRLQAPVFLEWICHRVLKEKVALNQQALLGYLNTTFWKFIPGKDRLTLAPLVEESLWKAIQEAPDAGTKIPFFRSYRSVALSDTAVNRLRSIWLKDLNVEGLDLPLTEYTDLACDLAIRLEPYADEILERQLLAITNTDDKRRFNFIKYALSPDSTIRDFFFESLKQPENRRYEPWVLDALEYLHHPLRASQSIQYILPSLELIQEIQRTGDIFFPKRWASATLSGHQSAEAADMVKNFLNKNPDYPAHLRNKINQAADMLFKAVELSKDQ